MKTLDLIFRHQNKLTALDDATDMLEDFAARGVLNEHSDADILAALGEYYRQCPEICQRKLNRGKQIASDFLWNLTNGGTIQP